MADDINDANYSGGTVDEYHYGFATDKVDRARWKFDADGVDRSRWKFDENGFALAKSAALETARREMLMAADREHAKVISQNNPAAATSSIDGVQGASSDTFKL